MRDLTNNFPALPQQFPNTTKQHELGSRKQNIKNETNKRISAIVNILTIQDIKLTKEYMLRSCMLICKHEHKHEHEQDKVEKRVIDK